MLPTQATDPRIFQAIDNKIQTFDFTRNSWLLLQFWLQGNRSFKTLCKKTRFKIKEKSDAAINVDVNDAAAELGIEPADDTAAEADTAGVASARACRYEP
jgi:hypothetical protein